MANEIVKKNEDEFDMFGGDLMTTVMMMVMMMAVMSQFLGPITQTAQAQTQALQAQAYIGNEDPRYVRATNHLSWLNFIYAYPFQPWVSAFIINDGPSPVEIGINFPDDRFTINPGETRTVSRAGAEDRINIMYFKCVPGLVANLRVTGVY